MHVQLGLLKCPLYIHMVYGVIIQYNFYINSYSVSTVNPNPYPLTLPVLAAKPRKAPFCQG